MLLYLLFSSIAIQSAYDFLERSLLARESIVGNWLAKSYHFDNYTSEVMTDEYYWTTIILQQSISVPHPAPTLR